VASGPFPTSKVEIVTVPADKDDRIAIVLAAFGHDGTHPEKEHHGTV
jgi:hypothetical protein